MAKNLKKVVGCPSCGILEEFQPHACMNASSDKDLREQILNETLFLWKCSTCDYETQMLYSCLYQDPIHKFMLYLHPKDEEPDVLNQIPVEGLKGIRKRIVCNVEEMKEKLLIFETGLSDYATELVKIALTQVVTAKWGIAPTKSYFCGIDRAKNTIDYVFYLNEEQPPVYQSTKAEVYQTSLQIVHSVIKGEPNRFLRIDGKIAGKILAAHQQMQTER